MTRARTYPRRPFTALFLAGLMALYPIPPAHAAQSDAFEPVPTRQPAADSQDGARAVAKTYLAETLEYPEQGWAIKNVVTTSSGVTAVYARRLTNGIEVVNADVNNNAKNGQIMAFGDSFYRGARPSHPDLAGHSDGGSTMSKTPANAFKVQVSFVNAPTPSTVKVTVLGPTATADASDW
ncbi:Fungalysin/Thermolysin Extracellular metalloproteinase 5 [Allomyces javanicus]|nr:Fungalysin/Thermolysin Extracellular metalloproteinase 5 [Allomyces javanicus]